MFFFLENLSELTNTLHITYILVISSNELNMKAINLFKKTIIDFKHWEQKLL